MSLVTVSGLWTPHVPLASDMPDPVRDFGAVGNGVTDDTAAMLAWAAAIPDGGAATWARGLFPMSQPLQFSNSCTLYCAGVASVESAAFTASGGGNGPVTAPYLRGSVVMPTTPGLNGVEVIGAGTALHCPVPFGIRFADPIAFLNTGHGFFSQGPALGIGGHDITLMNSLLNGPTVFGHDGNHESHHIVNSMLSTLMNPRGYGGGGLWVECDSFKTICGNMEIVHPYFWVFAGGTSQGYMLKARDSTGNLGKLSHIDMHRPQVNIAPVPTPFAGRGIAAAAVAGSPGTSMKMWDMTVPSSGVYRVTDSTIHMPDFEQQVAGAPWTASFTDGAGGFVVRLDGGFFGTQIPQYSSQRVSSTLPTFTPGAAMGTSPTYSFDVNSNEEAGLIRVTAGGTIPGTANGKIGTFGYTQAYGARAMSFNPANPAAATLSHYRINIGSATGMELHAIEPLTAQEYDFEYKITRYRA